MASNTKCTETTIGASQGVVTTRVCSPGEWWTQSNLLTYPSLMPSPVPLAVSHGGIQTAHRATATAVDPRHGPSLTRRRRGKHDEDVLVGIRPASFSHIRVIVATPNADVCLRRRHGGGVGSRSCLGLFLASEMRGRGRKRRWRSLMTRTLENDDEDRVAARRSRPLMTGTYDNDDDNCAAALAARCIVVVVANGRRRRREASCTPLRVHTLPVGVSSMTSTIA